MNVEIANRINATPHMAYLAITGGGASFIGDYLAIPGASRTIVGATVPYHQSAFDKFVGRKVESYCSEDAAGKLAVAAHRECLLGLPQGSPSANAFGVGVTCSLAKDNERVGRDHKAFLCIHNENYTLMQTLHLKQGRTRAYEEAMVNDMIGTALENEFLFKNIKPAFPLKDGESFTTRIVKCPPIMQFMVTPVGNDAPIILFPGSWNPFHEGHRQIYALATQQLGAFPMLELSIRNADKGMIDYVDVLKRVESMGLLPWLITEAATFKEKVSAVKCSYPMNPIIFVVGADTWERIWDAKYAGPLDELYQFFKVTNTKFLVFGRTGHQTKLPCGFGAAILTGYNPEDLKIQSEVAANFTSPLSSTEIRKKQHEASTKAS